MADTFTKRNILLSWGNRLVNRLANRLVNCIGVTVQQKWRYSRRDNCLWCKFSPFTYRDVNIVCHFFLFFFPSHPLVDSRSEGCLHLFSSSVSPVEKTPHETSTACPFLRLKCKRNTYSLPSHTSDHRHQVRLKSPAVNRCLPDTRCCETTCTSRKQEADCSSSWPSGGANSMQEPGNSLNQQ